MDRSRKKVKGVGTTSTGKLLMTMNLIWFLQVEIGPKENVLEKERWSWVTAEFTMVDGGMER